MGWRFWGGSSMTLMSRMPDMAIFKVRGIGVADRVSISTPASICLNRSLWATPNRCSSSMMARPRSLNFTSLDTSRWVPTTMSARPVSSFFTTAFCSLGERNRESSSISTGKLPMRWIRVW